MFFFIIICSFKYYVISLNIIICFPSILKTLLTIFVVCVFRKFESFKSAHGNIWIA